jgi:predicted nucleic acid-binding protein
MLIDTSGFLCLYERSEPFHANAVALYDQTSFRLTTNDILAEYTALAQARGIDVKRSSTSASACWQTSRSRSSG